MAWYGRIGLRSDAKLEKIHFTNGSSIEEYESTANSRGKRGELISFYCSICKDTHINHKMSDMMVIGENMVLCNQSFYETMEELMTEKPLKDMSVNNNT